VGVVASTDLATLTSFHICCISERVAFTDPGGGLALTKSSAPEPATAAGMLLGLSAQLVALKNAKRIGCVPLKQQRHRL